MLLGNLQRKNIIGYILIVASFGCFLCFLVFGEMLSGCVNRSLEVCAKTLIPSLFPLMIASRLLIECGAGRIIGKIFKIPFRHILGLSEGGAFAFSMGLVCGFPIGAMCAKSLYDKGIIGCDELSLTVVSSSVPSFAFIVGAIGEKMLGDRLRRSLL